MAPIKKSTKRKLDEDMINLKKSSPNTTSDHNYASSLLDQLDGTTDISDPDAMELGLSTEHLSSYRGVSRYLLEGTQSPTETVVENAVINLHKPVIASENATCSIVEITEADKQQTKHGSDTEGIKFVLSLDTLVECHRAKKISSNFRQKGKAIVLKPLDKKHNTPARIDFVLTSSSPIHIGDKIRIFIRNCKISDSTVNVDLKKFYSESFCNCWEKHKNSIFCVKVRGQTVSWLQTPNPTAQIIVENALQIKFASLMTYSNFLRRTKGNGQYIQELVFQVEKDSCIYEQTYYVKTYASPSRDIVSFLKELESAGFISPTDPSTLQSAAPSTSSKSICLSKISIEKKYKEEFLRLLQTLEGNWMPYSL